MNVRRRILTIGSLVVVVTAVTIGSLVAVSGVAGARTAPRTTTAAPTTAAFNLSVAVDTPSTNYSGSVVGQIDFATAQLAATINVPEGFGTIISAIAPKFASLVPAAVDADTQAQVIFSGGTLYLNVAGLFGSKWIGIPFGHTPAASSAFREVAKGLENVKVLGRLAKHSGGSVTKLGTKSINGIQANGYSTQLALGSLLHVIHVGRGGHIARSLGRTTTSTLGSALPVQVWAEPSGPVVQLSINVTPPAGSPITSLDVSLSLSSWGAPVTITAPPASDVVSLPFSL